MKISEQLDELANDHHEMDEGAQRATYHAASLLAELLEERLPMCGYSLGENRCNLPHSHTGKHEVRE